jgi:hypothetical protein
MNPDDIRITLPTNPLASVIPAIEDIDFGPGLSHYLSGDAAFAALKDAVENIKATAPKDHDVLIKAFDVAVTEVRYIEPHTLLFRGFNQEGHHTAIVAHYSQLVAHVVFLPKRGDRRVVTGFFREKEEANQPAPDNGA